MADCSQFDILSEEFLSNELPDTRNAKILFAHLAECERCLTGFQNAHAMTSQLLVTPALDFPFTSVRPETRTPAPYRFRLFLSAAAFVSIFISGLLLLYIQHYSTHQDSRRFRFLCRVVESTIRDARHSLTAGSGSGSMENGETVTFWRPEDYKPRTTVFEWADKPVELDRDSFFSENLSDISNYYKTREDDDDEKSVFDVSSDDSFF